MSTMLYCVSHFPISLILCLSRINYVTFRTIIPVLVSTLTSPNALFICWTISYQHYSDSKTRPKCLVSTFELRNYLAVLFISAARGTMVLDKLSLFLLFISMFPPAPLLLGSNKYTISHYIRPSIISGGYSIPVNSLLNQIYDRHIKLSHKTCLPKARTSWYAGLELRGFHLDPGKLWAQKQGLTPCLFRQLGDNIGDCFDYVAQSLVGRGACRNDDLCKLTKSEITWCYYLVSSTFSQDNLPMFRHSRVTPYSYVKTMDGLY